MAAVSGFLAAVILFLAVVIGFGPRALSPVGPLIAAARWQEAPV